MRSATSGVSQGLSGSLEQISCRCGRFGSSIPSQRATSGLDAPAAFTTALVRIVPFSVTTALMLPPWVSMAVARVNGCTSTPRAFAPSA